MASSALLLGIEIITKVKASRAAAASGVWANFFRVFLFFYTITLTLPGSFFTSKEMVSRETL